MYLYGTGGIAVVVSEIIDDQGLELDGYIDDADDVHEYHGLRVLKFNAAKFSDEEVLVCIGDNRIRSDLHNGLKNKAGINAVIHGSALLSPTCCVGESSLVFHDACIQAGARLGKSVIVNTSASIDHDCIIGDYCHIAPKVTLCGGVQIGEGSNIGANSVVIPNLTIGKWVTIGAGAVIIRDVPDYATVVGNPGRIVRQGAGSDFARGK